MYLFNETTAANRSLTDMTTTTTMTAATTMTTTATTTIASIVSSASSSAFHQGLVTQDTVWVHVLTITIFVLLFMVLFPSFILGVIGVLQAFLSVRYLAGLGILAYVITMIVTLSVLITSNSELDIALKDFLVSLAISTNLYLLFSVHMVCCQYKWLEDENREGMAVPYQRVEHAIPTYDQATRDSPQQQQFIEATEKTPILPTPPPPLPPPSSAPSSDKSGVGATGDTPPPSFEEATQIHDHLR